MYQRSKLAQTASALNGVPSWNLTPSRRWNVHVRPSLLVSHDVARDGTTSEVPGFCANAGLVIAQRVLVDVKEVVHSHRARAHDVELDAVLHATAARF